MEHKSSSRASVVHLRGHTSCLACSALGARVRQGPFAQRKRRSRWLRWRSLRNVEIALPRLSGYALPTSYWNINATLPPKCEFLCLYSSARKPTRSGLVCCFNFGAALERIRNPISTQHKFSLGMPLTKRAS